MADMYDVGDLMDMELNEHQLYQRYQAETRYWADEPAPLLSAIPTEVLLAELLRRHPPVSGCKQIVFAEPALETVIGIGKDNVANILLTPDDMAALEKLL